MKQAVKYFILKVSRPMKYSTISLIVVLYNIYRVWKEKEIQLYSTFKKYL